MPFDTSGNFNRDHSWQSDANAGIKIKADLHDNHDGDLAAGLSDTITRWGWSTIMADISWSGHKITNLAPGINPTDAVNKSQLDAVRTFSTGIVISGSTVNGMVTFTGATGPTGLSWTVPDISFGATGTAGAGQWTWNDKADGTGTDVMTLTESAALFLKSIDAGAGATPNLYLDRLSPTPAVNDVTGSIIFRGNDSTLAATTYGQIHGYINDPTNGSEDGSLYFNTIVAGTPATRLMLDAAGVNTYGVLTSSGAVTALNTFQSSDATTILATTGVGTVYLRPGGANNATAQAVLDSAGNFSTVAQNYSATVVTTGQITAGTNVQANGSVFGGNGAIYLRPNGISNDSGRATIDANGGLTMSGGVPHIYTIGSFNPSGNVGNIVFANHQCKNGKSAGFAANVFNHVWSSNLFYTYVDDTNIGWATVNSDYRIKKDVTDLSSTWEQVKALRPISYTHADFTPPSSDIPLFISNDEVHWGFIAHELQETLLMTAASGVKDMEDGVQAPNLAPILAATVKALQEAMARIEALEAQVAGATP